jgi:hypothetical protein
MSELAPYAAREDNSLGRLIAEEAPSERSQFQRDRDRIVHSTAFRRLEYKTQVFVNHEGDLFRTRLTHSIEVAQIARSIARALSVNEDLAEAVSLSHDLGPYAIRPRRAGCTERVHARTRRLRAQPAEPAHGRPAGRALRRVRRPEPHLRNARRHPEALFARPRARTWARWADASSSAPSRPSRRRSAIWPTKSPTTTTTSTTVCAPA